MSSFVDIKDCDERDKVVQELTATRKRIQQRFEDEKSAGLSRRRDLEEQFEPVVKSQREITENIKKHLIPIIHRVDNLPEASVKEEEEEVIPRKKQRIEYDNYGSLAQIFKERVLNGDVELDKNFGIRYLPGGQPAIGNKRIKIDGNEIIIDSEVYNGTSGLWSLLTDVHPRDYTKDDIKTYEEILEQTSVLHRGFDPDSAHPRANVSFKWKTILGPIWRRREDEMEGSGLMTLPRGCRVYLQRNGHCCKVQKRGKGLYLSPHPRPIVRGGGNGIYVKAGRTIYDGRSVTGLPPILTAKGNFVGGL